MNRALGWLAVSAAAALIALGAAAPAQAVDGDIPVVSDCNEDGAWYVNADEGDLLPEQVEEGLLFDGPSIVHRRLAEPVAIGDVPEVGFIAQDVQGVPPLFKLETSAPYYSTINVLEDGTAWSSKIDVAAVGGQNKPVTLDELAALAPYTADTRVFSFGVGYAKDTGNKATVTAITYGDEVYSLACTPPTESPSPTPTPTPTATPSGSPSPSHTAAPGTGSTPTPPAAGPSLPVTGFPVRTVLIIGAGAVLVGLALAVMARRWQRPTAR